MTATTSDAGKDARLGTFGSGRHRNRIREILADPLNIRIVLPVMLITVLATALSAFLIFGKFDRSLTQFEQSRYAFVLSNIRSVFLRDLDLGLNLNQIGNAQTVLDRQASDDPDIVALVLFDGRGHVLARAGAQRFKDVPPGWVGLNKAAAKHLWTTSEHNMMIAGLRLTNNFGVTVGGLAVGYSRAAHEAVLARMARGLTAATVVIATGAVLLTFLVSMALILKVRRTLNGVENELSGDEAYADGSAAAQVRSVAQAALKEIDAVNDQVSALSKTEGQNAVPPAG
jgi:hypothetical protein